MNKLQINLEVNIDNYISGYVRGYVEGFKKGSTIDRNQNTELMFVTKLVLKGKEEVNFEFCDVIKNEMP